MNDKKYRWLLYTIVTTILLTISIQVYWNYKNYLLNKQNFKNNVQISLDNALENYYADLAATSNTQFIDVKSDSIYKIESKQIMFQSDTSAKHKQVILKSISSATKDIQKLTQQLDSNSKYTFSNFKNQTAAIKVVSHKKSLDSIQLLKGITSIYISLQNDTLNLLELKPFITQEFKRKNFTMPFALSYFKNDSLFNRTNENSMNRNYLTTSSKTTFLKDNERLELAYPNATLIILKQGYIGILLSFILSLAIIASLLYLLKIIKHQKQLAEVKNDLISNITHEFKTPITTISVALEGITSFNNIQDKEKTKKYIEISSHQLSKLNIMVEKLLETATLDSNSLQLNKEEIDIVDLLTTLSLRYQNQDHNKTIQTNFKIDKLLANVDVFHFENALNNIADNALKYGGDLVTINLTAKKESFEIMISDNGTGIPKTHIGRIFEKFYRISNGNTHDVKGFGIGLYYTKTIIEKHGGSIILELNNFLTSFKITMSNA